jgi:UDP-glucose 4-epimerase
MDVLVTGARGFLGNALVHNLLKAGYTVIACSCKYLLPTKHELLTLRRLDLGEHDFGWNTLRADIAKVDVVYHLAWSSVPSETNRDPADDARVNIAGSLRLIQAIQDARSRARVVFASSGGTVYGTLCQIPAAEDHPLRPISAYGVSKRAVESYLDVFRNETRPVSLRMGNVYGPGQRLGRAFGAVTYFVHQALAGRPIRIFGDGSVTRDYLYIDDAVDALIRVGANDGQGNYNIGTGVGHSLNEVADVIAAHLGRDLSFERHSSRAFDVPASILDASRAREVFGWEPRITLQQGIKRTLHHTQAKDPET